MTAATTLPSGGATLAPEVVVRVATLPVSVLDDLRAERAASLVAEVLATDRWLADEGRALSDVLYEVIGRVRRAGLKPLLVGLRRATYNGRHPGDRATSDEVRAALPPDLAARLDTWLARLQRRDAATAELPAALAGDERRARRRLYRAVSNDVFRHGLVQGSPTLSRRLAAWLDAGPDAGTERKDTLKLAKYVARVTAKTSPYSTFTLTGIGRQDGAEQPARADEGSPPNAEGWSWRSVLEPNCWIGDQLIGAFMQQEELRARLVVRANPSTVITGDRAVFIRSGTPEALASLAAGPALRRCLDHLTGRPGTTLSGLRDHLARISGSDAGRAATYVDGLVSAGLVEVLPPFPDQTGDQLGALAAWLGRSRDADDPGPDESGDAEAVDALRAALEDCARASRPADRHARHQEVHSSVAASFTRVGLAADGLPTKNLVHETALLAAHPPVPAGADLERLRPELNAIRRFSALFSPDLPFKLACARLFAGAYGSGARVPLLVLYRRVRELMGRGGSGARQTAGSPGPGEPDAPVSGQELRAHLEGPFVTHWPLSASAVPEIVALDAQQRSARQQLGIGRSDGPPAVHLSPGQLDDAGAGWPPHVRPPDSLAFYLQPLPDRGDGPGAVLNECSIGYGRSRLRTVGLDPSSGGDRFAPRYRHRDLVLAECDARWGSNLNLRPPATEHAIDYPGVASARDPEGLIALNEMSVTADPGTGLLRLWWDRRETEVRPLHLGLLGEFWLPPAFRFLVRAFGEPPQPIYQALSPFFDLDAWREDPGLTGVATSPRIAVGNVVAARQAHYVYGRDVPGRAKGEADVPYLLRLRAWQEAQGIPRRCFVRVLDRAMRDGEVGPLTKMRKPMYVDLDAPFLVAALERAIQHPDDLVVVQEALPDPADAPAHGGERYVTEHIVELSDGVLGA